MMSIIQIFKYYLGNILLVIFVVSVCHSLALALDESLESRLTSQGIELVDAGKYEEGIELLKQVININPDSFDGHFNLGFSYQATGKYNEAIKHYKQALRIKRGSWQTYNNLGNSYQNIGNYRAAIKAYKKAIKLNPENEEVHTNLGNAYDSSGELEKAIKAYQRSIDINPEYTEAHYNLGIAYQNSGAFDKAIESHKQVVRLNPKHTMAHYNLGWVYAINYNSAGAMNEYNILENIDSERAQELFDSYKMVPISFGKDVNLYYDLHSITKPHDELYSFWTVAALTNSIVISEGKKSRIIYYHNEIDCNIKSLRRTKHYFLHMDNTKSEIEYEENIEWKPVSLGSRLGGLVKMVCSYQM